MNKIAHTIASNASNAAEALAAAENDRHAVARDQDWGIGLTRIVFDDNSFLGACERELVAVDCDKPAALLYYARAIGATPDESRYIRDILERDHGYVVCESDDGSGGWSLHEPGSTDDDIASGDALAVLDGPY